MSVKKFFLLLLLCFKLHSFSFFHAKPTCLLMLDPAGDARTPGRQIDDTYERSISLQCAELLKQRIEEKYAQVRVQLTRTAGETIEPLQNANFANCAHVNCFITLNFYQDAKERPQLFLYYFSYGNDFIIKTFDLAFYEYDQAYLLSLATTHQWASFMRQVLELPQYKQCCDFKGWYKLPIKPLIGIKAPAFAFEIGIQKKEGWIHCIEPILASLDPIIKSCSY